MKLSEVPQVDAMSSADSFIIEAGGSERRVNLETLKGVLASAVTTPPSTYTLEQNSNVAFDVSSNWAAYMYTSYMKGYLFKVVAGKVYAALLNDSWDAFADGTAIDNIENYETMVRVPKCHFKSEGTKMTFGGLNPVAGGHTFDSPEWVGAYKMFVENNIGHSRPNVAPTHSKKVTEFWTAAQQLGSNFGLANYQFQCLINAVYQAYYGNLNSQTTIGSGFQHSNWEACRDVPMGKCISLGNGSGKVLYNDATIGNQYPVKLFGFEDLWGKLWEFRPGVRFYMDGETRKAVIYSGNQVSNTASGREVVCYSSTTNGEFITKMVLGEHWDMIPTAVGGSDNTYYSDGLWANNTGEIMRVGGYADSDSKSGIVYWSSIDGFTINGEHIGARLAFFGTPIIVSGSQLVAM